MNTLAQIKTELHTLHVSSSAFKYRGEIPVKYTCDGQNVNPPLIINKIPENTKSLALIVEDTDAPIGIWSHWLVWNIPPMKKIKENSVPGMEGTTDFGSQKYSGPCPPIGLHTYHFKLYALDELLDLKPGATKHELEKKMSTHILAFGELIGLYKRRSPL